MVSSTRQAFACILIIISAAVFASAQTVQPKEPTSTISGKVTIRGKPAPGIFVGLRLQQISYTRQLAGFRAITDSEGKYRIENVAAGSYVIIPVAPAYNSDENVAERLLIVNKGETIENVDFVLVRGGAITGKVVDADGRPLIEEEVVAIPAPENSRAQMRHFGTRTDDRGIYRLFGLPPGRYKVAAGSEGFSGYQRTSYKRTYHPGVEDQAQASFIDVSEGSDTIGIDLTLGRTTTTYTATGQVIDGQTGQPMPKVRYSVTRYLDEHGSTSSTTGVVTNGRGDFRLENLTPGKYGVGVPDRINDEWRAEEVRFEVVDQDVTGLVIKTEKGATISGVAVLEGAEDKGAREQLTRAHVNASTMNETVYRRSSSSAMSAPDGSFRIVGLGGGTASFHVYSPTAHFRIARVERNGVIQPRGIEIKPGEQITGVRIFVNYGNASLRGMVTVENGVLPPGGRFFVWLRRLSEEPSEMGSWTDAYPEMDSRGQFLLENMFPGTYEISAGIAMPGARQPMFNKKQEVVVTAGSNNITITLDLSSPTPRP